MWARPEDRNDFVDFLSGIRLDDKRFETVSGAMQC
jgi:hypothetical protein